MLRDALGIQELALEKQGKVGKRNQAEQTPKVQVLNAANMGKLGSWVRLQLDWKTGKELKPQTLLPWK